MNLQDARCLKTNIFFSFCAEDFSRLLHKIMHCKMSIFFYFQKLENIASSEVKPQGCGVMTESDNALAPTKDEQNHSDDKPKSVSYLEVDKCKSCQKRLKSVIQHLKKSKECSKSYSESDMEHLKLASKTRSKERRKIWLKKNNDKVTQQNAARYQRDKEKIAKNYQENKQTILVKQRQYYDKDSTVRDRVNEYYQRNKVEIKKRRAEKKKQLQLKEKAN